MIMGKPIFGAVLAGLLISALALTAFRSILLLYQSIDISNLYDMRRSDERYRAGYDLFLMVIIGSGTYVLMNVISIVHYAVTRCNVTVPCGSSSSGGSLVIAWIFIAGILTVVFVLLFAVFPFQSTRKARRVRSKHRRSLSWSSCLLLTLLDSALVAMNVLPQVCPLLKWDWCSWAWCLWGSWCSCVAFLLLGAFALVTIFMLWILMLP